MAQSSQPEALPVATESDGAAGAAYLLAEHCVLVEVHRAVCLRNVAWVSSNDPYARVSRAACRAPAPSLSLLFFHSRLFGNC